MITPYTEVPRREEPPTKFFDQWLTPSPGPLDDLASSIAEDVEHTIGRQVRNTRRDATARRGAVVKALVANLANTHLAPDSGEAGVLAIATEKEKPTRYDRPDFPHYQRGGVLKALEEAGAIRIHPSVFKQKQTTIEPSDTLRRLLTSSGIRPSHIAREPGGETIWLAARTGRKVGFGTSPHKQVVSYEDTPESRRYRAEVEQINTYLSRAELAFDGEPQAPFQLRRQFILRGLADPSEFNLMGRLSGGFWMNLPSRERHKLTLRGESVADLDFAAMFAHLAYVRSGESLPNVDPYLIPGLEEHRDGAKMALLSLLSRSTGMRLLSPKLKEALPEGWTARRLMEAVSRHHPRIAHLFGTDIGLDLMFAESQLLVRLLLLLQGDDIPALPMHDGIMVPVTAAERATRRMQEAALEVVGVALPVKQKPIRLPEVG